MTQTEKSSRKVISGVGWVNPLTHDYRIDQAAHAHVFADAVELVQGVDYTVSNIGLDAGYVITITNAGAWSPDEWVLDARPEIDQASNLSVGGQFGTAFEAAIDKLTRRVQRIYDLSRRSLKTSISVAVGDNPYTLPAPVADKLLGWNAAGDDLENFDPTSIDIALVDNDVALAADSATRVASQHAAKTYTDAAKAAAIALSLQKAANLSDVASAPTARSNIAVGTYVADRTALKALDTTKDVVAVLRESNRKGTFIWTPGNFSTQIAADTLEGIYVKANAIASTAGAWVRHGSWDTTGADVRWFGVLTDDTGDQTAALTAALATCASFKIPLLVPAGVIKLGSTVTVPKYTKLRGVGFAADGFDIQHAVITPPFTQFSAFHLAFTGVGFDLIGNSDGPYEIRGVMTYRDQPAPGPGWTPLAGNPDIQVRGCYDVTLEELFLLNPSVGITTTLYAPNNAGNGRIVINKVFGQAMIFGLNLSYIYDSIYVDNVHWWPFWSFDTNVTSYTKANAKALIIGRADWPTFGKLFSWGMGDGVYFQNSATVGAVPGGVTTHMHVDVLGVDNCTRSIVTDATTNGVTASFDRITATDTVFGSAYQWTLAGTNAKINVRDAYLANSNAGSINIGGSGNKVNITQYRSSGIDQDANGTAEFNVAAGNQLVIGSLPITSAAGGVVYAFAGTGRISSPDWINFTPTISASTGAITTVAAINAGDCKYKLEGNTCSFDYTFVITTNGTGAGTLQATLPFSSKKVTLAGAGRAGANAITGIAQSGGTARLDMNKVDGTYPGADATTVRISGQFEIA